MTALAPEQYRFRVPGKVPADRLRAIIERCWTRRGRTIEELAKRSGVTSRTVGAIMNGERPSVRFGSADRVITALDPWLWQTSPPLGLADLYPEEAA